MRNQLRLIIRCNIIKSFQLMQMLFHLSTGLLYLIIVRIKNTFVLGANCSGASCSVEKLLANCARKDLICIPQDLDVAIEILDVSYNPITEIGKNDFTRYSNLNDLRLIGLISPRSEWIDVDPNIFTPLEKLNKLDISESAHFPWKNVFWPKELTSLRLAAITKPGSKFESLNLTSLRRLEDLNTSLNSVKNFPELHPEAPVGWIDLYNNPLNDVSAEHLAPYCLLKVLRLRVADGGELNTKLRFCQCQRLEQWMIMYNIEGFDFNCDKPIGGGSCEAKNFSQAMMNERQACLDRQPKSKYWIYMIIIALLSLSFPALYLYFGVYKKNKEAQESTQDDSGDVTFESETLDSETDDTPASETVDALEPNWDQ